jgi:acyl-CoA thioester hydrolase
MTTPRSHPSQLTRSSTSVVRVRYAETDRMGIVYYSHYLVWFEVGRTDWLRDAG